MLAQYEQLVKKVTTNDFYSKITNGISPTNREAIHKIEETKKNIHVKLRDDNETLTPKAHTTLRDFALALDTIEMNLIKKNRDNILQKFVYHSSRGVRKLQDALKNIPDDQKEEMSKMKNHLQKLSHSLESLEKKVLGILKSFANSSLQRELFYELYQAIFSISNKKLPSDPKSSMNKLKITNEDIEVMESRLKTVLLKIQDQPSIRDSLIDFIDFADDVKYQFFSTSMYYIENSTMVNPTAANPALAQVDDEICSAMRYLIQFLENAADGKSLNPTIVAFSHLKELTIDDNKLGREIDSIGQDLKLFLKDCLSDKKFIQSELYRIRFHFLYRKINDVLIGQYSKEIIDLRDKLVYFLDHLANDPGMKQLSNEMSKVMRDLKIDPATSEPEDVLKDVYCFLTEVFPVILSGFEVVPIPRVESSDGDFDLILDNIRVVLDHIVPSNIHIRSDTDLSKLKRKGVTFQEQIRLTMKDVYFSAYDIAFFYDKKSGMKKKDIGLLNLQDVGLNVDITLGFESFVTEAVAKIDEPNVTDITKKSSTVTSKTLVSKSRIMVENVDVKVHTLKLKFHDTKHDAFYTFFYPIIRMKMKQLMGSIFADLVCNSLEKSVDPNFIKHAIGYGGEKVIREHEHEA